MSDKTKIKYTGVVISAEEKQSKTGHSFWPVVINVEKEGGNGNSWKEPFLTTFFQTNPNARVGDMATVEAFVRGREYNGRFYIELRGDKYTPLAAAKADAGREVHEIPVPVTADADDDMPF